MDTMAMIAYTCCSFILLFLKCSISACGDVNFIRDDTMANYTSNEGLLNALTDVRKHECAAACYGSTKCVSFFYNEDGTGCLLHSTLFRATNTSLSSSTGHVYYRPLCPTKVSPLPNSSTHSSSTVNGSKAVNVVCKDGYKLYPPGPVLCDADGFWSAGATTCRQIHWINPPGIFTQDIPGNMFVGASILFTGSQTNWPYMYFTLNIFYANGDVALHMKAMISGSVSWKTKQDGVWGQSVVDTVRDPFRPFGKNFTCLVETRADNIKVSVDGSDFFTVAYLYEPTEISDMNLGNGIVVHEVDMRVREEGSP